MMSDIGPPPSHAAYVDQAISALIALSDPRQSHAANKWLLEFEKTAAAWDVAATLLREPAHSAIGATAPGNLRFHGANILHHKIRQDFMQLQSK